jgi:Sec-independent protein translocase protein TatA
MEKPQLNDETGVNLNIKWLIQIVVVVAMVVWGYSELNGRLSNLEHSYDMLKDKLDRTNQAIEESANGHNAWPMDVEQSTKIKKLEEDIRRIEDYYLQKQIQK